MEITEPAGRKTIREAVRDGSLIDVSEAAKAKGLQCRAFLCASLWDKGLARSAEKLTSMLGMFAGMYNFLYDYHHYGPIHVDGVPDLTKDKYEGYCTGILEPNDEVGLALVIIEYRTENELELVRTTGNSGEYAN